MMSIKTVNALSHYTDWTVGHVHAGALGWVAMITIGSLYCLIPRAVRPASRCTAIAADRPALLDRTPSASCSTSPSMWIAGVMQGLMWRAINADGTLTYTFVEARQGDLSVLRGARCCGGLLYLGGMLVMAWNVWMTVVAAATRRRAPMPAPARRLTPEPRP